MDRVECRWGDYTPVDPDQPCGEYACVDGQCRTAEAPGQLDNADFLCGSTEGISNCEDAICVGDICLDGTCTWDPPTGAFACHLPTGMDPPICDFAHPPPEWEDPPEGGGPGTPLDMYTAESIWSGAWTITDVVPCPAGIGCCWNAYCRDLMLYRIDRNGSVLDELRPAEVTGLSREDFSEARVAVVRDINGNGIHDVAVSAPYAANPNSGVRGRVFTFDGGTFELLRIRERDGAFGTTLGRVEGGLAATFRPLYSIDTLGLDAEAAAAATGIPGLSLSDRWGMQTAFIPEPKESLGTFATAITAGWIDGRELAVVYSPTCGGVTNLGCLVGYDQLGASAWQVQGWQSGNEFGASFDSDGWYAVVGIPGFNRGTGGMVRVLEIGRKRGWNLTQRDGVADFGRHVAIVESSEGPRVVASLLRHAAPHVLEMTLHGQVLVDRGVPAGWEVVGIVSPVRDDGSTDERYAIVYRTDDGWVQHQWFRAYAGQPR